MSRCQWKQCPNDATKVVGREPTEEQDRSQIKFERGASWDFVSRIAVCDDHLEEARIEYPFIANEAP
jgi:hypothetical protein